MPGNKSEDGVIEHTEPRQSTAVFINPAFLLF